MPLVTKRHAKRAERPMPATTAFHRLLDCAFATERLPARWRRECLS